MAFEPPPPGGYNPGPNLQPHSSAAGGGGSNFQPPAPGGSNFPPNNGNNAPVGGGGPPTPTPTPTPSAPSPPNPGLTRVVLLATEAIRLDQTGKYKVSFEHYPVCQLFFCCACCAILISQEAIQSYVYALEELLSLCRTETVNTLFEILCDEEYGCFLQTGLAWRSQTSDRHQMHKLTHRCIFSCNKIYIHEKLTQDIVKKNAYKSRAYTYMNRAEQLKVNQRH